MNGGIPPPSKRPRLSPHPQSQSPYASPSFGTLQLPQNPSPAPNGMNLNGFTPTSAAPPPPPPPAPGTMGPPSRPADKATDAAELTDVLASSGIDVREEEAFLTSSYSAPSVQAQQPPRALQIPPTPPLNTSFTSQASTSEPISTAGSFNSTSLVRPPASQEAVYAESAAKPPAPFKDPNEPTREDTQAARRAQYHLQEPFLLTKVLEQKLQKRGLDLGVRIPAEGLFHPVPGRSQPIEVTGPDGSSVVRTGQTILNQEGAPLVDILNLLSLTCEERLRNVIDYSATLARSRRAHSHGAVPTEWNDLAQTFGSTSEVPASPKSFSLKRPHSAMEKVRFLMEQDAALEEARNSKRAKRDATAILEGQSNRAESADMVASGTSTPIGEKAPSLEKKGLSKKEARKLADAKTSEAQQHQQSVETARLATSGMMSGRMFGTKKSYAWLTRSRPSGFSAPSRPGFTTPGAGAEKAGRPGETPVVPSKRFGTWREDKEKGAGIQVRDILFMLELDGRGARHVQKAYAKDIREDRLD